MEKESLASQVALKNLDMALEGTNYRCYTAVLERQYHPAVCLSYDITEFPTLIVVNSQAQVLHRELGARNLHEQRLREMLQSIDYHRAMEE